jgi:hypothetical protein
VICRFILLIPPKEGSNGINNIPWKSHRENCAKENKLGTQLVVDGTIKTLRDWLCNRVFAYLRIFSDCLFFV